MDKKLLLSNRMIRLLLFIGLFLFIVFQRIIELQIAKRNERLLKARGGIEYGQTHYKYIVILHVLFLMAFFIESIVKRVQLASWWWLALFIFVMAQVMRFWIIYSLGLYWNTKIIVLPNADVVRKGPYRFLRHPNYVIVAIELVSLPLVFQAYVTAAIFSIANLFLLMQVRIPAEEAALREQTDY